jgi:hypothetical protein
MRRGIVERDEDVSGVTGTGIVSEFCIASDGRIVIFWPAGHGYFNSLEEAVKVHGHNGKTRFIILDDDVEDPGHCKYCHSAAICNNHDFGCPRCLVEAG